MNSTLYRAWLQYSPIQDAELREAYRRVLGTISLEGRRSELLDSAIEELRSGCRSLLDIEPELLLLGNEMPQLASNEGISRGLQLRVQPADNVQDLEEGNNSAPGKLGPEGFRLEYLEGKGQERVILIGGSEKGLLYGVFHLLRLVAAHEPLTAWNVTEEPVNRLRMINQWDNADGSIERGYAGRSIFYRDGRFTEDLTRVKDYARLLSSVGINAISINNVNVHEIETRFITREYLPQVAQIASVFRKYGITLYLSINFAAPLHIGGVGTSDPLNEDVRRWWRAAADEIYSHIPDFGGFLVKADSEHRPGPFAYGRDHADGANMLAEALKPHGGIVIWRCFVYNCMQDWRDRSTDRAKAAYDHFTPLDGRFMDNVLLQIKNGPMDFQVREPVSPLFGSMKHTNQVLEFQVTQEYTGQQRHVCYLVPQWKDVLNFDTHADGQGSYVKRIVSGSLHSMKLSGIAAVSNIGDDENWTGHTLAQANLYGYGRLIWNPDLTSEEIAEEWTRQTFGNDEAVIKTACGMLMKSWPIYESYTSPLGVGWMVTPHTHYGPDVDGYEYSRWGTYHFADRDGIGVDRTAATGTGYTAQYFEPNARRYETLEDCPDELLLFFHHVPYSHRLKSGKTVIQHIYDTHFEGADAAAELLVEWASLEGRIDPAQHAQVAARLAEQAEHAKHWRDVINTYFFRKSGVPDGRGRTIF
ncbi:alpha-glucuronidase family glycosyl hydrolase [Paenibacillus lactis]|uniref:Xylan alpha-1,2-glucuronidase n=1 Tax=Paenibacillus lactis TaxID=228574 RepID=A0ABS4F4V3_9BACL|nr:alpha-glucuronidase family glycosyl hydrolase [Paenibacillus lactis]MBP1891239.1 alpha-glucuronidase [Paenibacillus lactis]HAF98389.1 alpha-glucuronidase [Paenibacillus lactis]